jgi:Na+/H+-dicarboxylate symporter
MNKKAFCYFIAIIAAAICGLSDCPTLFHLGFFFAEIFMRIFRCISMPIVFLSITLALVSDHSDGSMKNIWKKTLFHTFLTTIAAATVAALLYAFISPPNVFTENGIALPSTQPIQVNRAYGQYLLAIIPESVLSAFIEHNVLSVLLIGVVFGLCIRLIEGEEARKTIINFFRGIHGIFFAFTRLVVAALPLGMFGFLTVSIHQSRHGMNLGGMGKYLLIVVAANLIQGLIVLPLWLTAKGIHPFRTLRAMFPALSVAFFSKSSAGTLPVTMEMAEKNLGIRKETSRFVLPLCTTINMNGCAAFIFTTVVYVMQNYGIPIHFSTMISWIFIATLAAIGNAGVPMGCFFLSTSLLSSMAVPTQMMGMILPFYALIDMLETALNVWSDSCIVAIVSHSDDTLPR